VIFGFPNFECLLSSLVEMFLYWWSRILQYPLKTYLHLMIIEEKTLICHEHRAKKTIELRAEKATGLGGLSTRGCTDWKMGHISFVGS